MARDRITAKDRERAAKVADREHLAKLRERVRALKTEQAKARKRYARERVELLRAMRSNLRSLPKRDRDERTRRLRLLAAKRAEFRKWWERMLIERTARRALLEQAATELRDWRRGAGARIAEAKRLLREQITDAVDQLEDAQSREFEALSSATAKAERDLRVERSDQKSRSRNARDRAEAKPKTSALDKRREFTGGVEANLTSELALATWKRARKQILAEAKRRGVTSPDGVAEIVQEWTEADEDRALEYLQADADAWLEQELRKKGLAA